MRHHIRKYEILEQMASTLAEELKNLILKSLKKKNNTTLLLSGGRTPLKIFKELRKKDLDLIPWSKVHVYWLDERFVPHSSSESNFGNAYREIFRHCQGVNLYPMKTDLKPEESCKHYESLLKGAPHYPVFDYALIGFGEDGHIASLFNQRDDKEDSLVVQTVNPAGQTRLSLTSKVFNQAEQKVLIGSGEGKKKILEDFLEEKNLNLPLNLLEKTKLKIHFTH